MVRLELATPGLQTECSSHWATRAQKLLLGRSWVYPVGVLHHYIFIISQLWLTSHQRSIVVLLDTETPGTSKKFTVRMPMVRLELATPGLPGKSWSLKNSGKWQLLTKQSPFLSQNLIRGSAMIVIPNNVELCKQHFLQEYLRLIRIWCNWFSVIAFMEKDHSGN